MDNESLERIRQLTKDKITVANFQENECMKKYKKFNVKRIAIAACLCLILTSGIVFQKDVKAFIKYCFAAGEAADVAAANGYVEETNMNFIDTQNELTSSESDIVLDDIDVSVKIDEFLMDDINLSTNFSFKFDDKIKEFLDLDNLQFIFLQDLVVYDEENRIIATNYGSKDVFEKICKENNLDYDYNEYSLSAGILRSGSVIDRNNSENLIKYGINCETQKGCFPNSKELNFVFSEIKLEKYNEYNGEDIENGEYLKSKSVVLTGDWKINVKVPEKMYNRPKHEYKAVSISNPNISLSYAFASESGFKIGVVVSNVKLEWEMTEMPFGLEKEELFNQRENGEITEDEFNTKMDELTSTDEYREASRKFHRENDAITTDYFNFADNEEKSIDKITHITNSNGKQFEKFNGESSTISYEEGTEEFSGTYFEMTKSDATDELTFTIIYYGEPVEIKLERIK